MELAQTFLVAVRDAVQAVPDAAELLPSLLSRACVAVLPVEGAGLSMTDELRVPLGSSDPVAACAERLQVTLGEGPCLAAVEAAEPQVYDLATIAARWPLFYSEVTGQTPYRSVASIPITLAAGEASGETAPGGSPLPRFGTLDLYCKQRSGLPEQLVDDVAGGIAETIAAVLFAAPTATYQHGLPLPTWLNVPSVTHRMNVWVAVGMLMEYGDLDNADALAMLRAYAFGRHVSLDDIADQITDRRLTPEAVLH